MTEIIVVDAVSPDNAAIDRAAGIIRKGGLVVYPTETLYGIGADALNPGAVAKIHEAKRRRENKPILVIVHSNELMKTMVGEVPLMAEHLMSKFWPGPLTIVFRAKQGLPEELTGGTGSIGIRMPSNEFCLGLVGRVGRPVTSTSANISGEQPARTITEIRTSLHGIDLFVDAGELPASLPSTVVDVTSATPILIRTGAIPIREIQKVIPTIHIPTQHKIQT